MNIWGKSVLSRTAHAEAVKKKPEVLQEHKASVAGVYRVRSGAEGEAIGSGVGVLQSLVAAVRNLDFNLRAMGLPSEWERGRGMM